MYSTTTHVVYVAILAIKSLACIAIGFWTNECKIIGKQPLLTPPQRLYTKLRPMQYYYVILRLNDHHYDILLFST